MKYEKPNMELVVLEMVDVITVSDGGTTQNDAGVTSTVAPDNWG